MEGFGEFLTSIKFPTLTAAGMSMWFGYMLIGGADVVDTIPEGFGVFFLALGAIFLIVTFIDFRYQNSTDDMISNQGKTISMLHGVVKAIGHTKRVDERMSRKSMTSSSTNEEIGGYGKSAYKMDDSDATLTS